MNKKCVGGLYTILSLPKAREMYTHLCTCTNARSHTQRCMHPKMHPATHPNTHTHACTHAHINCYKPSKDNISSLPSYQLFLVDKHSVTMSVKTGSWMVSHHPVTLSGFERDPAYSPEIIQFKTMLMVIYFKGKSPVTKIFKEFGSMNSCMGCNNGLVMGKSILCLGMFHFVGFHNTSMQNRSYSGKDTLQRLSRF